MTALKLAPQAEGENRHLMHLILLQQIANCDVSYKKYEITFPLTPKYKKSQLYHALSKGKGRGESLARTYCCFFTAAEVSLSKAA